MQSRRVGERESADASELTRLVEELLERFEREGPDALEELCATHPTHASALRRRFALLADAGVLAAPRTAEMPERLGDFRLLRPLGGGGMGVVYLALQEPLGREVALKIVRPEHLYFPGARERFQREVDTIARLQHPGIVPIYAVGEERGVPYFAMERVLGHSLEHALAALRGRDVRELRGRDLAPASSADDYLYRGTWEEACLRVMRQVAEALEYAHQQGVLHRDIKPSNVMLSAHGASRAMLLDFGLATASGTAPLTRTGAQLGTLQYMSPEQTRGERDAVSVRSDVYALGVTLYELLTLARPFDGASDVAILGAIERGQMKRPRERNPSLSEDAEIVCLAALEHDPARRYATAADFARDLGNVLDHHPIEARRASVAARARKWLRRHPATGSALALGALIVIGGPASYAWQQRRAAVLVRDQRDRAEANLVHALEAVDRMLTRVGNEELRFEPRMEKLRATLLEDAVQLLQRMLAAQEDDPRLALTTARVQQRLGTLLGDLARTTDALAVFDSAIALLSTPELDAGREREILLARVRAARAAVTLDGGDAGAIRAELETLIAYVQELAGRWPDDDELDALVLGARSQLASHLRDVGEVELAAKQFESVLADQELISASSDDPEQHLQLAEIANDYAVLLLRGTRDGEHQETAEHWLRRSIDVLERTVALTGGEGQYRNKLAAARANLGGVLRRAGDLDGARALYGTSLAELEQLVRDFPATPWFRFELATVHNQLGVLEDTIDADAASADCYAAALAEFESVARAVPDQAMVLQRLGTSASNLSVARQRMGEAADALRIADRAVEALARAVELAPEYGYGADLAFAYRSRHNALFDLGRFREAASAIEDMTRAQPTNWKVRTRAAAGLARCLQAERDRGELPESELEALELDTARRAADQLRAALERGMPDPTEIRTIDVLTPLHGLAPFEQLLTEIR